MTRGAKTYLVLLTLALLPAVAFAQVEIGSLVVAYWQDDGMYYFGTPVEYDNSVRGGAYLVIFEDGSQALVPSALVTEFRLTVGTEVYAAWGGAGSYPGKVDKIVGRAVYVLFDDGDEGWTSLAGIALERQVVEK